MVAGGRKKKKRKKKKNTIQKKWVQDGFSGNSLVVPALNLVRKSVRYKKQGKMKKKNKVLDFVKLEYYKEVLDFHNIEYHITFLITQISGGQQCHTISGGQQCHTDDSSRNLSFINSSTKIVQWQIAKYFQNSVNLPQIMPKRSIWLFSLIVKCMVY